MAESTSIEAATSVTTASHRFAKHRGRIEAMPLFCEYGFDEWLDYTNPELAR
jgi:hypothetical protein